MLRFELKYHVRQLTFFAAALVFFIMGVLAVKGGFGGPAVHKNGPYAVTVITGMLTLLSIFTCTLFCANVVLRDSTYKMDPIIFATAVTRRSYFTARLLGLTLAVFIPLCLAVAGIAVGPMLGDSGATGPIRIAYFLQPLFVLGLPNTLFTVSILFSAALLTRNPKAVYAAGLLLYVLYLTASILGNSPLMANSSYKMDGGIWPLLTDPFGLAPVFAEARSWTDQQRNTQFFTLSGAFGGNRAVWSVFSVLLLAISYSTFRFRQLQTSPVRRRKEAATAVPVLPYRSLPSRPYGSRYLLGGFFSQLALDVRSIFRSIPFWVMLILWMFLYTIELNDILFRGPYGLRSFPYTGIVIEELRPMRPALVLIIFCAAELIWRERIAGMHALVYATPVRRAQLWAAKSTALAVLIAVLISANIAIGIGLQWSSGFRQIELPLYGQLFYYSGLPLFLFALLCVFILTITPSRYGGMLVCFVAAAVFVFGRRIGLESDLLRYASAPELLFSYMNGYGHHQTAFHWHMLYWGAFAALLSLLAIGMWRRPAWKIPYAAVAATFLLWVAAGAFIYWQTNVKAVHLGGKAYETWQLAYEQKYRPFAGMAQPVVQAVSLQTDLFPETGDYRVRGRYQLKNEAALPLDSIWLSVPVSIPAVTLQMPGVAHRQTDAAFNQHWLVLEKPLQPGDTTHLDFTMNVNRGTFLPFDNEHAVVTNGSYIELEKYVPSFGYDESLETNNRIARKKAGLPARVITASTDDNYHLIHFTNTISTSADQQAITVGALQKTWTQGSRRYFTYTTPQPIRFMFALSAAQYALHEENYRGVRLRAWYHPGHNTNLPAMLQGMKDALDFGSTNFAPYPLPYLHLAEIPQYRGAATAYPGLLFAGERICFLGNYSDTTRVNQAYVIAAHETAHQWWANMPSPVYGPGDALLTESLAKYTEAAVLAQRFGEKQLAEHLGADNHLYFAMRNQLGTELPLTQTYNQPFAHYQKGGLALYTIREKLGEARFHAALQRLVAKHAYPGKKARPADLVNELCLGADSSEVKLVRECLQQVVDYELQVKVISVKPLTGGAFQLVTQVSVKKQGGNGRQLPPEGYFDIAVLDGKGGGLYRRQHHFTQPVTTLTLTLARQPATVAIDPRHYILDADLRDNEQAVE